MRAIRASLFQSQHKQMKQLLIPLFEYSTDRYHLNILIIINIIYKIYIECELYYLAYTICFFVEQDFINSTIGKWKDHYSFTKKLIY